MFALRPFAPKAAQSEKPKPNRAPRATAKSAAKAKAKAKVHPRRAKEEDATPSSKRKRG